MILTNYGQYYNVNSGAYAEFVEKFKEDSEYLGAMIVYEGGNLASWISGLQN